MGFRSGLSGRQERTKGERRMIRAVNEWIIRKRDGRTVPFESKLIFRAICNAFRAELNLASGQPLDADIEREVGAITEDVVQEAASDAATDRGVGVEHIQDLVEMQLMKRGHYRVARRYIVYRARAREDSFFASAGSPGGGGGSRGSADACATGGWSAGSV